MQKNKYVCEVPLTKLEFVDILNRLREATELVDKVEELFRGSRENLECDFCNGAGLQISHEGIVVKLLEKLMRDSFGNISYFIYELDYGREYQEGCVSDKNGNIDISTPEKLYDFLMTEYGAGNGNDNIDEWVRMMLRIKEAEDFGLGFNCMTRLYMDRYDEEILMDMIKVCEEYLKWFSHRTIICSLRDLIREYPFSWNEEPVPETQVERYEVLIKDLIRQAIGKKKQRAHYTELRGIVNRVADDIGVTNSWWGKEKNFARDSFYQWVMERGLVEVVLIKEVKEDEILPLKKKYVPLFYKVCNYMIDYSYGRHTYMPSTCRSFVKKNLEIMSDAALMDIVEYLRMRNADIPENERAIDKIDSDNWIYMQEDLEAELLIRQMFYKAQEKAGNVQELYRLLDGLLVLNSLHTQRNCLHMYHQLMGIKRYLTSVPQDAEVKKLLKLLEDGEKVIGEKRVEFFEKEEGHLYEKIGEGIYQRKR